MPRSPGSATARIVLLAFTLGFLFLIRPGAPDAPPRPPAPAPAIEDPSRPEDPGARAAWEARRLRVPATGRIPAGIRGRELAFAADLPRRSVGAAPGGGSAAKGQSWHHRGPWNIGGRTRGLAVDVSDPTYRTLLAGGVSGGMWRSTDDGANWVMTTGPDQLHNISCLLQDTRPGHTNEWYFGTGEGRAGSPEQRGDVYRGDGIAKSTDGGLSWQVLPATSTRTPQEFDQPFDFVWRLAQDTTNLAESEIYAATWGVIYRSTDGGRIWIPVLGDGEVLSRYTDVAVGSDGVVYATLSSEGGQAGIYRSPDGVDWTLIRSTFSRADYGRIAIGVSPSNPEIVTFLVSYPVSSLYHDYYRYTYTGGDGAAGVWSDRSTVLDNLPHPYGGTTYNNTYSPQRGYNMVTKLNPVNPLFAYLGGVHLWRSFNGFLSITATKQIGGYYYPYPDRTQHGDQHDLVWQPGSATVAYAATDGGVYKTLDINASAVAWTSLNNGYTTTQFYTVALDEDRPGDTVVLGGTQDNGTLWTASADGAAPWAEIFGGDGAYCEVLDAAAGDYVVSYYFGNMWRIRIDAAGAELDYTCVKPAGVTDFLFINPFIDDPADGRVLYAGTGNGVWMCADVTQIPWGGTEPVTGPWAPLTAVPVGDPVSALAANGQPGHSLYYGTAGGGLYRVPDVLGSPGAPIALDPGAGLPVGAYVSGIAVHPDDDDQVLVCFGNYGVTSLWATTDGGATWTDIEGNLAGADGPSVRCVAIVPGGVRDLWLAGTSTGLYSWYRTEGETPAWILEAPELLGNAIVDNLAVRQSDRTVAVATHGRGILTGVVPVPSDVPEIPVGNLAQNAPNPFNPSTRIAFDLAEGGAVRLEVFDVSGRRVAVLVDGELAAGPHTATWHGWDTTGREAASGVYLYRLTAPGLQEERRMTLIR